MMFWHAVGHPHQNQSNLGSLIPVSSSSLGWIIPAQQQSQLDRNGISERVQFFWNVEWSGFSCGFCSCAVGLTLGVLSQSRPVSISCVPDEKWVASGLLVRPLACFGFQNTDWSSSFSVCRWLVVVSAIINNPVSPQANLSPPDPDSHLNINTSQSWTLSVPFQEDSVWILVNYKWQLIQPL